MTRGPTASEAQRVLAAALLDATAPPQEMPTPLHSPFPTQRLSVYRNSVLGGLVRVLAARFPVVERMVGEAFFGAMAREFILHHPPRSPVMVTYGEVLPDFIADFSPAASLPYLADLARLEDAWWRAYHASSARPLPAASFADLLEDPERLADTRIGLHPSLTMLASPHPVVTLWAMHQPGMAPSQPTVWAAEEAAIVRPHLEVRVLPLGTGAAAFLRALDRGAPLLPAAQAGALAEDVFDLTATLATLIGEGIVVSLGTTAPGDDQ